MGSQADAFENSFDALKEFVDNDGRHYYVIQFEDDSGRILRRQESDDDLSLAEFTFRDEPDTKSMRKLAAESDFEFDEETNTQQNLRNLMS
ncbi:hypothetical protein OB920_05145 [Halobacteria archaeon HArc-gm2]|nr:hypothetical protein [Halobacteria archaeon HArc-gm2]